MNSLVIKTPPGITVSEELAVTLVAMKGNRNQFKRAKNEQGRRTINGVDFKIVGENNLKIGNNTYELTPEIQKALTQTSYDFNKMSGKDIFIFSHILNEINYDPKSDCKSERRDYIKKNLNHDLKRF